MRHLAAIIVAGLVLLIVVVACGQPAATPTPIPPTTAAPPVATPKPIPPTSAQPVATAAPAATTAGELAALGKSVYDRSCSSCHNGGPGPGVSAWMQAFPNAQQILDYVSRNMPKGAPGSLRQEQYFQIVAWALVDEKIVSPDVALDINQLATVPTKK